MRIILLLSFLLLSLVSLSQKLVGVVTDADGNPLAHVSIFLSDNSVGTTTNNSGEYEMKLSSGAYEVVFSFVGFETQTHDVEISNKNKTLNVLLKSTSVSIDEASVVANTRDRAREIMKEVRSKRSDHLNALENFKLDLYQRISLTEVLSRPNKADSLKFYELTNEEKKANNPFEPKFLEITETERTVYFQKSNKYKEYIHGVKEF